MSIQLGNITIVSMQNTSFAVPNTGIQAIVIGNESGLTCTITMESGGVQKTLYPSTVDWFQVKRGFTGNILIHPVNLLSNATSFPSSELIFDAIGLDDPEAVSTYPLALARTANVGNASVIPVAATSIVNDGNIVSTPILEATVLADGSSAVLLTNDAKLTLGDAAHHGSISLDNAKITSDGSGNLTINSLTSDSGNVTSDGSGDVSMVKALFTTGSISRISHTPVLVGTAPTFFNHNLGAIPDFCICQPRGTGAGAVTCIYDNTSMSTTQVKLTASQNNLNIELIAIKF